MSGLRSNALIPLSCSLLTVSSYHEPRQSAESSRAVTRASTSTFPAAAMGLPPGLGDNHIDALGSPLLGENPNSNPMGLHVPQLPLQLQTFSRLPVLVTGRCSEPGSMAGIVVRICTRQ